MKKQFVQRLRQALPWLWMAAGYAYTLWYHIVPGKWIIDADLAGEMVLADLLNQEGGILSTNWYYTTELRVFHMQWLYRLGLLVFPHDWQAARTLAMALCLLLVAAIVLFFFRTIGCGRAGVWVAAAMMWPFGFWYLFLCSYGAYYFVYMMFALAGFSVVLRLRQSLPRRQTLLWTGFGVLLALMSGLNGVRQMMMFYCPLFVAALALAAWHIHHGPPTTLRAAAAAHPALARMAAAAVLFTFSNGVGYLLNMLVLCRTHSYYKYDFAVLQTEPASLLGVWRDYLHLYGYEGGQALFSLHGIGSVLGLLLGLAILFSLVWLCLRFGKLEMHHQFIVLFFLAALLIDGIVFAYTALYTANYWLPILPFGFVILALAVETTEFRLPVVHPLLILGFMLSISLSSLTAVNKELSAPLRARPGMDTAVEWLVDNGYKMGYATFWNSQLITELSDGQIEMCAIDESYHGLKPWLQRVDHEWREPTMPCFSLFSKFDGQEPGPYTNGARLVYEDSNYWIYAYDDPAIVADILTWGT